MMPAEYILNVYIEALAGRDSTAASALFGVNGLFEFPLLGQRLVGRHEIQAGLERIFAVTESCTVELTTQRHAANVAIAEGTLFAKLHREAQPIAKPMALVAESSEGRISRLSFYLDSRNERPWSDGPLFGDPTPRTVLA